MFEGTNSIFDHCLYSQLWAPGTTSDILRAENVALQKTLRDADLVVHKNNQTGKGKMIGKMIGNSGEPPIPTYTADLVQFQ
jgi:hypothetical protein